MGESDAILARILSDRPALHPGRSGEERCIGLNSRTLEALFRKLSPGMSTLETGCGLSTLIFALAGCNHLAIVPNQGHVEATRKAAGEFGIDLNKTDFRLARSEDLLPTMMADDSLDVVLIDGGHAFPIPYIDWFYAGRRLKASGLLVVDDTNIKTVAVLCDFLDQQPAWSRETEIHGTAFYRVTSRITEANEWDYWRDQPFNLNVATQIRKALMNIKRRL